MFSPKASHIYRTCGTALTFALFACVSPDVTTSPTSLGSRAARSAIPSSTGYDIIDLGALARDFSYASAITPGGLVVGVSATADGFGVTAR